MNSLSRLLVLGLLAAAAAPLSHADETPTYSDPEVTAPDPAWAGPIPSGDGNGDPTGRVAAPDATPVPPVAKPKPKSKPASVTLTAPKTFNVCTFTLGSKNTVEEIKSILTSGQDRGHFNFIELSPADHTHNHYGWFNNDCSTGGAAGVGKQCDIVIDSGHFGVEFFGEDNHNFINGNNLEKLSCREEIRSPLPKCGWILSAPIEVWLPGCNTLALKDGDPRDPFEYLDDLRGDGYTTEHAERAMLQGMLDVGPTFREQMRRIYPNARHMYGYATPAPFSEVSAPHMGHIMTEVRDTRGGGSYYRYMVKEWLAGHARPLIAPVANSATVAKYGNFGDHQIIETSGVHYSAQDSKDFGNYCRLLSKREAPANRLQIMSDFLKRTNAQAFFFGYEKFLNEMTLKAAPTDDASKQIVDDIETALPAYHAIENHLRTLLQKWIAFPYVSETLANVLYRLNWYSQAEYTSVRHGLTQKNKTLYARRTKGQDVRDDDNDVEKKDPDYQVDL